MKLSREIPRFVAFVFLCIFLLALDYIDLAFSHLLRFQLRKFSFFHELELVLKLLCKTLSHGGLRSALCSVQTTRCPKFRSLLGKLLSERLLRRCFCDRPRGRWSCLGWGSWITAIASRCSWPPSYGKRWSRRSDTCEGEKSICRNCSRCFRQAHSLLHSLLERLLQ